MSGLDLLVLDCLRESPHPSHFNLEQSLDAIAELKPRRAILTNLHVDLDYASLAKRLPAHIEPAFDGMKLTVES
jgi:phosphoribosyl 1,2-cyclic phosphate phosphodiesterase